MKKFLASTAATLVALALIKVLFDWGAGSLDNLIYFGSLFLAMATVAAWVVSLALIRRRWA